MTLDGQDDDGYNYFSAEDNDGEGEDDRQDEHEHRPSDNVHQQCAYSKRRTDYPGCEFQEVSLTSA